MPSIVNFLRGKFSKLPNKIENGTIYVTTDKGAVYADLDDERIRLNPSVDWKEPDPDKPTYIANKPTTIDGYGITNGAKIYYDTTSGWSKKIDLISEENAFYVYTDAIHTHDGFDDDVVKPNIKVGDGLAFVVDLPFLGSDFVYHINDTTVHITEAERLFWNAKCSVNENDVTNERIEFTTN